MPEADLRRTEQGLVPDGEGWFVLNAREARWRKRDGLGARCVFEGEPQFGELGVNVTVLAPGEPLCMYHGEGAQEDFLVLDGECLLLIEGQERPLRAWDFVHCPSWTEHVLVGSGDRPCVVVAVGARRERGVRYPESEVAQRHGAGVEQATDAPAEAYARFGSPAETAYREGWLPDR